MRLQLLINNEWREVECDQDTNSLTLSWAFDSIDSPTKYYSEFSYEFKVPKSETNNALFDQIQQLDYARTGGTYNPAEAMKYILYGERGEEISKGMAKLTAIDTAYHVQLNGSLGVSFAKLLKAGWDTITASEDSEYTLLPEYVRYNGVDYNTATPMIDASQVACSWAVDSPSIYFEIDDIEGNYGALATTYGVTNTENECVVASIVGFMPQNQGKYKDFSNDKWLKDGGIEELFKPSSGDAPETDGGLTEWQMQEYRSYYQQPFVYVARLWSIFKENCKNITGYDLILDDGWYDSGEPIADLVYTLPANEAGEVSEVSGSRSTTAWSFTLDLPKNMYYTDGDHQIAGLSSVSYQYLGAGVVHLRKGQTINNTIEINLQLTNPDRLIGGDPTGNYIWNVQSPIYASYQVYDSHTSTLVYTQPKPYLIFPLSESPYIHQEIPATIQNLYSNGFELISYYRQVDGITYDTHAEFGSFQVSARWMNVVGESDYDIVWTIGFASNYLPLQVNSGTTIQYWPNAYDGHYTGGDSNSKITLTSTGNASLVWVTEGNRSYSPLTLERLFNGVAPFSILLKHCKLWNLVWVVDDVSQTLTVKRKYDYFLDNLTTNQNPYGVQALGDPSYQGFLDITELIDAGRGLTQDPLTFSGDKVALAYKDTADKYSKSYKDKYSKNYGSLVLATADKTTHNTIDFFEGEYGEVGTPIVATDIVRTANSYTTNSMAKLESVPLPSNVTDNGEQAGVAGVFYFRDTALTLTHTPFSRRDDGSLYLTDDDEVEANADNYCWHANPTGGVKVTELPQFTEHTRGEDLTLFFGEPRETYYELPTAVYSADSLYDREFADYLTDAYSIDNKRVTCYAYLSDAIYQRLKINPLVQIVNVVYLVEKMEYNPATRSAKLVLRQIISPNALTGGQL